MLAVPHSLRNSIAESNHIMLPITDVISKLLPENSIPFIVSIEVEVESVYNASSVVIDYDGRTNSSVGFAASIRGYTLEPGWVLSEVINRRQIDAASAQGVEGVEVVECQRSRGAVDWSVIVLRYGVKELRANVRR